MRKEEVQHRRESDRETERESLGVLPQSVVNLGNFWTMGDVEQGEILSFFLSFFLFDVTCALELFFQLC